MNLQSGRLFFKIIDLGDIEKLHQMESVPEVNEFNTIKTPENLEETKQGLQPLFDAVRATPPTSYYWTINLQENMQFMEMAGMILSNDKFKLGEIFYKLLPGFWGNGYGTESSKTLIKFGFEELKLHKVEAGVATENHASIKVLEKSGMIREGLRRKILPIRGEWKDNYHYAIVEDDPRDY